MILDSPVKGTIHVAAENYPGAPGAWNRPGGNHDPAVTHDFGPSTISEEPTIDWPGGETNIYGTRIPKGHYPNFHCAVDLYCGGASPAILAPAGGTVLYAGLIDNSSRAIVIYHGGGIATGSSHMAAWLARERDKVARGETVGKMGDSGNARGIHDHYAQKVGFPGNLTGVAAANAFYRDGGIGRFVNPLRFLRQFITVRPKLGQAVNIRSSLSLAPNSVYAVSDGTRIERQSDHKDIGSTATQRKWYATHTDGPEYTVGGRKSKSWEEFALDGRHVFMATLLAVRSI